MWKAPWLPRRRLATLFAIIAVTAVFVFLFADAIADYVRDHGLATTLFVAALALIPLAFIALCWGEILRFFFPARSRRRLHRANPPDLSEFDPGSAATPENHHKPKRLRWSKLTAWFHSRWIGPGGYR